MSSATSPPYDLQPARPFLLPVGHVTDLEAGTGLTVVLCPSGAVGGVAVRGGSPGTRETDALHPLCRVQEVHGVVLTGGSAFGLDAAGGVVRYLEERGHGFATGVARVPIVPAAVIFDLALGSATVRPTAEWGYRACLRTENLASAAQDACAEGSVGAGTGATVGKQGGMATAMKGGLGLAGATLADGTTVTALLIVNALGDVLGADGRVLAGGRHPRGHGFAGWGRTRRELQEGAEALDAPSAASPPLNTTIGVVATDAPLAKHQAARLAAVAHDGLARAVYPAHTPFDGDTIFVLSLPAARPDPAAQARGGVAAVDDATLAALGAMTVELVAEAIVRAVLAAEALHGVPAARDWAP